MTVDFDNLLEMRVLINDKVKQIIDDNPECVSIMPQQIFTDMFLYYSEQKRMMARSSVTEIPEVDPTKT